MDEREILAADLKDLYQPPTVSRKGENGKVFIIGGNEHYHGAPLFCAKIASKIVDLVFFSSVAENNVLVRKMRSGLADFIVIDRADVYDEAARVDVILIGPGMGTGDDTKEITDGLLKKFPDKKFVLDADALRVLDKSLLNKNCVVTPNRQEFKILFGQDAAKVTTQEAAKKYNCIVVAKGPETYVSDGESLRINQTGNAGMTKGGTGDVLAGLIAGLSCKNDLFLASCAAVFINGTAADALKEKVSYYFNASDLIEEIPATMKKLLT
ncbi:MAG TPA: NAD(P)H-hydrate dehydratase [Candidatus Nanoarchaeia archaeon]|nr:bifunctional NAD(P)H-hydrate repair enzyme Nnr [uncultured archaeon]